ncbi:prolipoprotein diacylglyceryl transferase [Propionibacteriaceae bacterium Y1700]|uniref:prolipoprotein diacylglyceryl transferase n=1 Tax=Microlunatus sp. Y1700 TaxID=3418487 RepID=UPI003DA77B22
MLHHPDFDPVALRLGPIHIQWYAVMYLIGFAIGYLLLRRRLHHEPFASTQTPAPWRRSDIEDILVLCVLGVVVGGRLGYCLFYKPGFYLTHPLEIFAVWQGGMSFHGGAIGVALALVGFALRRRRPILQVTDLLVPAAPIGLACGRFGNFINGELWGRPADPSLPWSMIFGRVDNVPRHPSPLYEMLLEGLLLFVVLWLYARKNRPRGRTSGLFLIGYGVARSVAELFREPDDFLGLFGGVSMGQLLSAPMILGGLLLWFLGPRTDQTQTDQTRLDEPDAPTKGASE